MKDLLLYHALETDKDLRFMQNNEVLRAKNGKSVRFNKYRVGFSSLLTAQCVPMTAQLLDTCGGSLQYIAGVSVWKKKVI